MPIRKSTKLAEGWGIPRGAGGTMARTSSF